VTVAWGRDYGDVAPLRGVIRGGTAAHPQVEVTVEPL
jgi:transglutaminase-like putative cysteine protease